MLNDYVLFCVHNELMKIKKILDPSRFYKAIDILNNNNYREHGQFYDH